MAVTSEIKEKKENDEIIIEVKDVKKIYTRGKVSEPALDGVSLSIRKGDFITIQGPSGCGKTTLLNMVGMVDTPTSGDVIIGGVSTLGLKEQDKTLIRRRIGFVFQAYNLLEELSALDNVAIALAPFGIKTKDRNEKAKKMLELVDLGDKLKNTPSELSGGEQQRVAIARAIVIDPSIILADEPTGNLDTEKGEDIIKLFRKLNEEYGHTFLIVTHNKEIAVYGKRKILMKDHKILSDD